MGLFDAIISGYVKSAKKESYDERKKRLVSEGKANASDFEEKPDPVRTPVLDSDWSNYAAAKAADEEKKKRPTTKAGRAINK